MEVLLGLLTIEPMSGYDLGQMIDESIHHFWNESYGQIYPNLKRLASGGFVTRKIQKQRGKPDRNIYSITKKGRERLQRWLQIEPQSEVPRNELLLKLFFGSNASPQTIKGYVEKMAANERVMLERFTFIEREIAKNADYPDAPYWQMALRFGQIELQAHMRWTEETLTALCKLDKAQDRLSSSRKDKGHAGK
ncbi:MAG TPA: PadR family transcriptional regulator [Terracidiphilus sp.]|nr:PadR family transcriptional regulator [Terracidiphilus sp.]